MDKYVDVYLFEAVWMTWTALAVFTLTKRDNRSSGVLRPANPVSTH